jgi:hypothetical protein
MTKLSEEILAFENPLPICALDNEGLAVIDEFPSELLPGTRVAIPNPWHPGEGRYLPCVVRGQRDAVVLEVGQAIGQVAKNGNCWYCIALVQQGAIAKALLEDSR